MHWRQCYVPFRVIIFAISIAPLCSSFPLHQFHWFRYTASPFSQSGTHYITCLLSLRLRFFNSFHFVKFIVRCFNVRDSSFIASHSPLIHFVSGTSSHRSCLQSMLISWRTNAEDTSIAASLPFVCFPFIQLLSFQSIKLHTAVKNIL